MATAGAMLYAALWPYVAELEVKVKRPRIESATYEEVAAIYGTGGAARGKMADALGLSKGREGTPERRARQSFLEAARRWEAGRVANPSRDRGYWRRLVQAAADEAGKKKKASRRLQLDTLSSMVADAGLLIRRVAAQIRVSQDDRFRDIDVSDYDDEENESDVGGIYLAPEELEGGYGARGENFYDALEADDWETAALVVLSAFMDKYTEGDTGGYPAIVDDVDLLEIEIP